LNSRKKQTHFMAGVKGRSGPPGNQNNFVHGLSRLARQRTGGLLSQQGQSIRDEILAGPLSLYQMFQPNVVNT
jgi:hypothetical protein